MLDRYAGWQYNVTMIFCFHLSRLAKQRVRHACARHLLRFALAISMLLGAFVFSISTASAQSNPPDPEVGGTTIECTSYYHDSTTINGNYVTANYSRSCRINNYPACPDQEPPNQGWAGYDLSFYTEVYYSVYSYFSGYFWGAKYTTDNTVWDWFCYLGPCEGCPQSDIGSNDDDELPKHDPLHPE